MPHDDTDADGELTFREGATRQGSRLHRWRETLLKYLQEAITTLASAHVIELEASKPQERDEGR